MGLLKSVLKKAVIAAALVAGKYVASRVAGKMAGHSHKAAMPEESPGKQVKKVK